MRVISAVSAFVIVAGTPAIAGKPGPTADPQIAYVTLSSSSTKLIVTNLDGTNASTLYTSSIPFRFDLAPRAQKRAALSLDSNTDPAVWLLSLTTSGSGSLIANGSPVRLRDARGGTNVDFSPDGSKIAFACCSDGTNEKLVVYDLSSGTSTEWATATWFWDIAWFRGGASIAYSAAISNGNYGLFEVAGPNAAPLLLLTNRSDIYFDASRANSDALVVNYHDSTGHALTGLFQAPTSSDPSGHMLVPNLTNSVDSFHGGLSCEDKRLVYLGPPNQSPDWYTRELATGLTRTYSKTNHRWVQFWPDPICP